MANLFSFYATLLLLSTSNVLMVMVASDTCKELIGECSNQCNNQCVVAHQGNGYGICEAGGGGQIGCWCYYDCPPQKTCEDGFLPQGACNDQNCDAQCVTRHPGKAAQGFCYNPIGLPIYGSCRCTYFC